MSEERKFVFGSEKLPAKLSIGEGVLSIIVDASTSTLITDYESAIKKAKEYGVLKEVRVVVPKMNEVDARDTAIPTPIATPSN